MYFHIFILNIRRTSVHTGILEKPTWEAEHLCTLCICSFKGSEAQCKMDLESLPYLESFQILPYCFQSHNGLFCLLYSWLEPLYSTLVSIKKRKRKIISKPQAIIWHTAGNATKPNNKILTIFTKLSMDSWWAVTLPCYRVTRTSILTLTEAATIFSIGPHGTSCNRSIKDEWTKQSYGCIREREIMLQLSSWKEMKLLENILKQSGYYDLLWIHDW